MRKHKVVFRPRAEVDLSGLYDWIAEDSGEEVAAGYIDRIEAACLALETFPQRGTRRDDIRQGLRTIGFERRATIAFRVTDDEVVIIRIFYGGRDFERAAPRPRRPQARTVAWAASRARMRKSGRRGQPGRS